MIKKNSLFDLIKTLSVAEKRYFKRSFAGSEHQARNYLRLFDMIDKMSDYDELAIKKKFKGEKFVNQLHVIKIYLQENILKSLRRYHASASQSMSLKDTLKNIEIYFHKELYNHCALEIQKAERISRKYEDDIILLETLNWKRKLAQHQSPGEFNIREIIDEQTEILSRLMLQNKLWKQITGGATEEVSFPEHDKSTTLASKILTYHIRYRNAITEGRNNEARKNLEELLALLEKHPYRIEEEPSIYLSTINNLISFLVFTRDHKQAIHTISKAKTFYNRIDSVRKSKSNVRLILRTYNIELEIYRDTESLDDAEKLICEIRNMLSEQTDKVPQQYLISLWFQFAYIFFLKKDFRNSLHWINEILNASFAEKRRDLHLQAHLLNLMVHLELRNFFVMRYFVTSTKRFFTRNKALKEHHKTIMTFFIRVSDAPESEQKQLFRKLFGDLFEREPTVPQNDLDYINWKKWVSEKAGLAR